MPLTIHAKIYILGVSGSPGNAIVVDLCYVLIKKMLFLPFVDAVIYKIWKKERKVISLADCKLKYFSS